MAWTSNVTQRLRQRLRPRARTDRPLLESDFRQQKKALMVHGLHKSATMFLYKFFDDLCRRIDVPLYSVHNSPADHTTIPSSMNASFVLCPMRSFSIAEFSYSDLESIHLFQTRDPRDILVSEYYSLGWRHTDQDWDAAERNRREKIRQLSIDDYVLQEPEIAKYPLLNRYRCLLESMGSAHIQMVKYETMVLDFEQWLGEVIPLVGLTRKSDRDVLLKQYREEFRPDSDPGAHKRNIVPGDHRRKLQPETIELLNIRFATVLRALGYD